MFKGQLKGFLVGSVGGLALTLLVVWAYTVVMIDGGATIQEGILVDPTSFVLELYPGEEKSQTINFTNLGSIPIELDLSSSVSGPDSNTVSVSHVSKLTVSALSSAQTSITVEAKKNVIPGAYTISIAVER